MNVVPPNKPESRRPLFVVVSTIFLLLAVTLAATMALYWIAILQPRLHAEALSQAELLARSQANAIVNALRSGDGAARVRNVVNTLDELLLLRDTQTNTTFFRSVELKIDYDVVRVERGSLDLRRGETSEGGFREEVALYDPSTVELMGVATFRVSDRFFVNLRRDVRNELLMVGLAFFLALVLVWGLLLVVLGKMQRQRQERDAALRELVEQEQKYQRLIETLSTYFVYARNESGALTYISESVSHVFAMSVAEAMKQMQSRLLPLDSGSTGAERHYSITVQDHEGQTRYLELSELRVVEPDGAITFDGIGRDVTTQRVVEEEMRQAKEAAEEANRAKSLFLANMSHEIRTPLNAILGMSALATKHDPSPKVAEYLDKIRASAKLLAEIIEDILDLSRIEAGRMEIERVEFDLDEMLSELSDVVGVRAGQKNLEILFNTAANVPRRLRGDPVRLKQVLLNLLNNALKFTTSGEIVVEITGSEVRRDRAELRFSVRDTGIGIAEEDRASLFEPFTQVDGTMTRRFGGMGLGLAISQRLVRMMGGELTVESELGAGSTFSFTSQFDVPRGAVGARRLADEFRDLPVLVADDNASARAVLANMLRSLSCRVTAVSSGEEAIAEAVRAAKEGSPYRLALLDWKMPGVDGAKAAERLTRGGEMKVRLPVILVTAYEREYASACGREIGIDAVLHKPVSPSMLHDAVLEVLTPGERHHRSTNERPLVQFADGKRVLVVEDNEINRQVARELLTIAGIEVEEAHNGYQAMEKLASSQFDAVLMDVQMPELDGIETVKAIRAAHGRFSKLPVIAMTAHAMLGDRERFLEAGMSDYIAKPIEEDQLLGVLSRWINLSESAPQHAASVIAPPAADDDALPGLLLTDGIRRASGNVALYKRLLSEFRRELDDMLPRLVMYIENNSSSEGTDLLHTLKGSASTLGARRVAENAAALESKLRKGESIAIDELAEAANEARQSIERYLGKTNAGLQPGGPAGLEAGAPSATLIPIAQRLEEHLRDNNLAAVSCFEELKSVAGTRFREPMQQIELSLDRLDFDAARSILKAIEKELTA